MKILYFCNVNMSIPLEAGVYKKIQAQCKVLRNDGHDVKIACPFGETGFVVINENNSIIYEIDVKGRKYYARDSKIFKEIIKYISNNSIEFVYTRYGKYTYDSYRFYNELKKNGIEVILEIPTYPISQRWSSFKQSLKARKFILAIKQLLNNTYGSLGIFLYKKCISRIVNNNGFDEIWGIPVIPIQNGIDVASIPHRKHVYVFKKELTIMSVANVNPWHGFDRLIKGLYEYYLTNPEIKVIFEIVGPGTEIELLRSLAKKLNVKKYVVFHGTVVGKELDEIFERADIGVAILGVHRNNMKVYDCLKSREFCARKLPFITQDAEVHFQGKRFVLSVPNDESPIDIKNIISFYEKMISDPSILDEMYEFANEKCDWSFTFMNVRNYLLTKDSNLSTRVYKLL